MKTSAAIAAAAVTMDKGGEHAVALSACALSLWIGMWVVLPSATLWLPSVLFGLPRGLALTCGIWATLALEYMTSSSRPLSFCRHSLFSSESWASPLCASE